MLKSEVDNKPLKTALFHNSLLKQPLTEQKLYQKSKLKNQLTSSEVYSKFR